jgi:hypothetical protein
MRSYSRNWNDIAAVNGAIVWDAVLSSYQADAPRDR